MDWDDMRVFLAVARAGSVAAAARELEVEHSTVGRRIGRLEADVGAPLFYRTRGGYQLTPQGESARIGAEAMERAALGFGGRLREGAGDLSGRVRVAMLDEFASHWLMLQLPAFHARYPNIELQVLVGIAPLDLSRGEADLAVRFPRPRQPGLSAVRLGASVMRLYASRARLGGKRARIDATSRGLELLVYVPAFERLQGAAWFQPVLASSKIVMATNSTHALLAAARAGAGVAVVARFMAAQYEELVEISDDVAPRDDMWLVTHPDFRKDPRVRATAAFLRQAASALR
jgi:DNA-binding transcriptional LysR family regulator